MTIAGIDSLAEPSREIIFIATAEPSGLDDQNAERIIRRDRANGERRPADGKVRGACKAAAAHTGATTAICFPSGEAPAVVGKFPN